MGKQRLTYIDIAKGICIVAIVLGHMRMTNAQGERFLSPYVFQFHVPVFFIVSGFFLKTNGKLKDFVLTRARRLLVPYVVTCLCMGLFLLVCKICFGTITPPTIWGNIPTFVRSALWGSGFISKLLPEGVSRIGALWFLEALLVALIEAFLLLRSNLKELFVLVIAGTLALVAVETRPFFLLPLNVQQGLAGCIYVIIGYYYAHGVGLEHKTTIPVICLLTGIFIWCGHMGYYATLVEPKWVGGTSGFVASLYASYLVLQISLYLSEHDLKLCTFFEFCGRNSLDILCVHQCCQYFGFLQFLKMCLAALSISIPTTAILLINFVLQLTLGSLISLLLNKYRSRRSS